MGVELREYEFTTYNSLGDVVGTFRTKQFNIRGARNYVKLVIGNSKDDEVRNSRIRRIYGSN